MKINLGEYAGCLKDAVPEVLEVLEANYAEAARVMSPQGLHNYLQGAQAFCGQGRGLASWLETMPLVCKEVGDTLIPDVMTSCMKLTSMVSSEVVRLVLASLPIAARRLGDAERVLKYLDLIHQLSARVPRSLRPMLGHIGELLGKLTLDGLRRWALWGAQAYALDLAKQTAYFNLETPDSQKILQQERHGILFIDVQRKLNSYLRALWGRDFVLRPTSGDYVGREGLRPYLEGGIIHLPDAMDDLNGIPGLELYRAACAHAAAHLDHAHEPISAWVLNPMQMFLIGLIEDARIETLAIREFPGLYNLWAQFHDLPVAGKKNPVVSPLERLASALLHGEARAEDAPLVREMLAAFQWRIGENAEDNRLSRDLGIDLYNRIQQDVVMPSWHKLETEVGIPYRDDNRMIWQFTENVGGAKEFLPGAEYPGHETAPIIGKVNEINGDLTGDDIEEARHLETELFPDEGDDISDTEMEGKEPVSVPYHYNEWDYQVQLYRPNWVTVLEKRQPNGDPSEIDLILDKYKPITSRLQYIIDGLIPQGIVRKRHQEEGDEIDINDAIKLMIDLRRGEVPDPRVHIRYERKVRDLAVMLLLDLSESTNDSVRGSDKSIIQLAREAAVLLACAVDAIGDPFAIHGFSSNTRHDVQYYRFKDFGQPYDDQVKARLAGMQGSYSTRMGAAFRHAAHHLSHQPQVKKLLLLVSDGEPSDIDVQDPQYLRYDTKKAVQELVRDGIRTYADRYQ